jgi:hypothetical protein
MVLSRSFPESIQTRTFPVPWRINFERDNTVAWKTELEKGAKTFCLSLMTRSSSAIEFAPGNDDPRKTNTATNETQLV